MHITAFTFATFVSIFIASPAFAQTVITQAKALAGNVTPGDTAGYPITLSQSGAYRLESNLAVPNGQYGIFAGADGIDIDLNGFIITGSGVGTYGIVSNRAEGRIHDGSVSAFRGSGIYLRSNAWVIEDMKIVRNNGYGIDATDSNLITVRRSILASNGGLGVYLYNNGVVENNTVVGNGIGGIFIYIGGRVEDNEVYGNAGTGIVVNNGGIISGNTIRSNMSYGIDNGPANVMLYDNVLLNNNPNGTQQILGGVEVYGNVCVGKPC